MSNFNFFGDSWFWTWNLGPKVKKKEPPHIQSRQLADLNKHSAINFQQHEVNITQAHSIYEIYLKHLGHDIKNFCNPTQSWEVTVDSIEATKLNGGIEKRLNWSNAIHEWDCGIKEGYSVVFYSSIIRNTNLRSAPVHDKKSLEKYIKNINIGSLDRISSWAKKNKQKVILIGGQARFDKSTFNIWKKQNPKAPIHLASSDAIATLIRTHHRNDFFTKNAKEDFGYWKLASDIDVDDSWDLEILNDMDEQQKFFRDAVEDPFIKPYIFPDGGHPSMLGQYCILDLILSTVENKFN